MDLSTVYSNFIKVVSATFIDEELEDGYEYGIREHQEPENSSPPTTIDDQAPNEIQVITDTQPEHTVEVLRFQR